MNKVEQYRVILFDLGGVLLRLNDPIETFGLEIGLAEFKSRWLQSPSVRKYESGGMEQEEFAENIVAEASLPYDPAEFIRRFNAWPDRLFDETLSLLRAIPPKYNRALLSNINPQHWGRAEIEGQLTGCFDHTFLSYQTGLIKPDHDAFELVVKTFDCRSDEVLFFDDSMMNVEAAADFGMQAVLTIGIDAVENDLQERGILLEKGNEG